MARGTVSATKTSLLHRFSQALFSPSSNNYSSDQDKNTDAAADGTSQFPSPASSSSITYTPSKMKKHRAVLEKDIARLQERLNQEQELHSALEDSIAEAAVAVLPNMSPDLPDNTQKLLTDVAVLEVAISQLEEHIIALKMQIRHERSDWFRNAACHKLMQDQAQLSSSSAISTSPGIYPATENPLGLSIEQNSGCSDCRHDQDGNAGVRSGTPTREELNCSRRNSSVVPLDAFVLDEDQSYDIKDSASANLRAGAISSSQPSTPYKASDRKKPNRRRLSTDISSTGLCNELREKLDNSEWRPLWMQPNRLSEDMVSCMIGIYTNLANSPETAIPSGQKLRTPSPPPNYSVPFDGNAKEIDPVCDDGCQTLPKTDVGNYRYAVEVSWMTVGKQQLKYAGDALQVFRSLVQQLSKVDLGSMSHEEKLAFWINVYNALMMHAYLAYGVPKDDVEYFALMQKAAYTVGGHAFNAITIEHVLLRGKAPTYRPQIALLLALHKMKVPEGVSKYAISRPEPLVIFALSCGVTSSPAVRIYTKKNVNAQLELAMKDYIQASMSVTKDGSRIVLTKLLHSYARHQVFATNYNLQELHENQIIINWLGNFLLPSQITSLHHTIETNQQHQKHNSAIPLVVVLPFCFRFRYLFIHKCPTHEL